MSLYRNELSQSELARFSANQKFFKYGFVVLAISGLLMTAYSCVYWGLHWHEVKQWSNINWLNWSLWNLTSIVFAFLFLRYLRKRCNKTLIWASFLLTVVGAIGQILVMVAASTQGLPKTIGAIGNWIAPLGNSGSPVECILIPLMDATKTYTQKFQFVLQSIDYVIDLLFLGVSIVKYSKKRPGQKEKQGLAHRAHA
jgi:hypothetical protein